VNDREKVLTRWLVSDYRIAASQPLAVDSNVGGYFCLPRTLFQEFMRMSTSVRDLDLHEKAVYVAVRSPLDHIHGILTAETCETGTEPAC
jgi:hypothetical protein